jgi:hypothetical protein
VFKYRFGIVVGEGIVEAGLNDRRAGRICTGVDPDAFFAQAANYSRNPRRQPLALLQRIHG